MKTLGQILVLFVFWFSTCFAQTLADIGERYLATKTFKSRFKQVVFLANLNEQREFSGSFYYKKGRGFLWVYDSPRRRYFLFDGTYLYQYDEEKPFITKEKIDSRKSQSLFLDLINDVGNLDKHFVLRERLFEGEREIVHLEPKNEGMIRSVKIWFTKELKLDKIEILERNGNKNVLFFRSVVLNEEIEDSNFLFRKESGKEVIVR